NIERNPDVFQRILAEGHHVINHSYSHDYKKIYTRPEAFLDDLEQANHAIAAFTGEECKIFRAPGGPSKLNKNFRELLNRKGYRSLGWNVASADTDPNGVSPEQIVQNVIEGVNRIESMKKTPIILMHDGTEINVNMDKPGTATKNYIRNRESDVAALPVIIEFLQEKGYTFAGVDENTPPAW
ncbi:MAG: polysaccharide deacetylase family protein, partial [Peptococcaceae bacterium]|nr:polysaccharide deacetylase family protein [Peptococcaceae bacterium]